MSDCTFCHGAPVYNAGAWVAPGQDEFAACPRCGAKATLAVDVAHCTDHEFHDWRCSECREARAAQLEGAT
jgi:hypothetical protein